MILKGTKDLTQKLQHVTLHCGQKNFIVMGDIVIYYPNIPVDRAVPIVLTMFMEFAERVGLPQHNKHTFITCMQIAVKSPLFMRHASVTYEQIHRVPMGATCSPDIANL
jgi:hypothetical protein